MRRPEFIARQAGCPSGLIGHVLARVMALETAHENERAVQLLAPDRGDHVLEIGFGHGRTIARLAAIASEGTVAGVEVSPQMLRMASRFNRRRIEEGRIVLTIGNAASMPYPAERFDRALSVHTLYFWSSLAETLREIRRVMKPGGRLVLGFRSSQDDSIVRDFPRSVYRFYRGDEVERSLEEAGFQDVFLERSTSDARAVVFAVAICGT